MWVGDKQRSESMVSRKKIVITYGTFDLLHHGHIRLLKRAKSLGDYLVVGLSSDSFNNKKGKKAILNYKQRKEVLQAVKYVDKIIPERGWNQKRKDIDKYNAIMVMGDDWKGKFDEYNCIYLPRTKIISTSYIKRVIRNHIFRP